jgi:AcrR family transcriptional regulator
VSSLSKPTPPHPAASSHDRILAAAKHLFAQRGYENTATVAIARAAGTSESQLMKHFGSKEGLLEAIFEQGWRHMGQALGEVERLHEPKPKLRALLDAMLRSLETDPELKELMLLEGRRIRREGNMVMMTSGFLHFVAIIDGVLDAMRAAGQLREGVHPQAMRSALIGIIEGLLRDEVLARRVGYAAAFGPQDISNTFDLALGCFMKPGK